MYIDIYSVIHTVHSLNASKSHSQLNTNIGKVCVLCEDQSKCLEHIAL